MYIYLPFRSALRFQYIHCQCWFCVRIGAKKNNTIFSLRHSVFAIANVKGSSFQLVAELNVINDNENMMMKRDIFRLRLILLRAQALHHSATKFIADTATHAYISGLDAHALSQLPLGCLLSSALSLFYVLHSSLLLLWCDKFQRFIPQSFSLHSSRSAALVPISSHATSADRYNRRNIRAPLSRLLLSPSRPVWSLANMYWLHVKRKRNSRESIYQNCVKIP